MTRQDGPVAGEGGESVMECLLLWLIIIVLLMSSIGFGYFCRLGYCGVHGFVDTSFAV